MRAFCAGGGLQAEGCGLRATGYGALRLCTHRGVVAALGIHQPAGYRLQASEKHHSLGQYLVRQTWEETLAP